MEGWTIERGVAVEDIDLLELFDYEKQFKAISFFVWRYVYRL